MKVVLAVIAPLLAAILVAGVRATGVFDEEAPAPPLAAGTTRPRRTATGRPPSPRSSRRSTPAAGPDGITVAEDGIVWVADFRAGTLAQISADENVRVGRSAPGASPTAPWSPTASVWVVSSARQRGAADRGRAARRRSRRARAGGAGHRRRLRVGHELGGRDRVAASTAPPARSSAGRSASAEPARHRRRRRARLGHELRGRHRDPHRHRVRDVVGEPIDVGNQPRGVAVGEGSVWVANAGEDTVTRIDPKRARSC